MYYIDIFDYRSFNRTQMHILKIIRFIFYANANTDLNFLQHADQCIFFYLSKSKSFDSLVFWDFDTDC